MKEINIAKILKNKPRGTKLYSPIFDECTFSFIQGVTDAICVIANDNREFFDYKGLYSPTGKCLLFPSRYMHDWSKFTWKRGDVLVSNNGKVKVIFDKFRSNTYLSFIGKYHIDSLECNNPYYQHEGEYATGNFKLEEVDAAQAHINTIEERLGGKLNRETLEIEKQTEFKDGDVVVMDAVPSLCYSKCIFILKGDLNTGESCANSYIFYNIDNNDFCFDVLDTEIRDRNIHIATEEEKQQLFGDLAKKGKAWDAEKKRVVDLKPKVGLKPFDKVLVRDYDNEVWRANLFSNYISEGSYGCVCGAYKQCIPYEGNEHLLGTTNNPK